MKILLLSTHFNTGGITSYLMSLSRGLIQRGHKVFLVSAGGNCESVFKNIGGNHLDLGFRTKSEADLRIYLNLRRWKNFIEQEDIDVIHAQTRITQVMGHLLSLLTRRPLITTCHGFFRPHLFRRLFPCWGDAVIAISQPVRDHLKNDFHVKDQRIHVVANGLDMKAFPLATQMLRIQKRKQWDIKAHKVIGIIARLSDVKGIDVLLKSMPLVIKQFPNVLLMIVGEGDQQDKLLALSEKLNLNEHVRFENIVNQTADILPVFDLFVMPSRQEGLGLSVMEAQACGLPVIASKVGGLVDLIEEGKTGYLVPPQDQNALSLKIIEVLSNQSEAQGVGLAARESIAKRFSLEQMVSATQKVYEKYISR